MITQPQIIEKEGKKEFVVLPYEEFIEMQELLEDYLDLKTLRAAKSESITEKAVDLALIKEELLEE